MVTAPYTTLGLSERLAIIIEGLCQAVAARGPKAGSAVPLIVLAAMPLRRMSARFASLAAAVRDGRLARAPTLRRPALTVRAPRPHRLPRGFGWLIRLVPEAAVSGSQLQYWMEDPELVALLARAPQAGRILRSLCRMLAIRPGPALRAARRAPPTPLAVRRAASNRPALAGGWTPDARSCSPRPSHPAGVRAAVAMGADPPLTVPDPA
jgi:hypothetical protein